MTGKRYWLTPPALMEALECEYGRFDFDPCPYPLPEGWNGLDRDWGRWNYVNPPFRRKDSPGGDVGPTAFARKAIEEAAKGRGSVIVLPIQSYAMLLLEAGAEVRSVGRVPWLDTVTGEPCKSPSPICAFILRPRAPWWRRVLRGVVRIAAARDGRKLDEWQGHREAGQVEMFEPQDGR